MTASSPAATQNAPSAPLRKKTVPSGATPRVEPRCCSALSSPAADPVSCGRTRRRAVVKKGTANSPCPSPHTASATSSGHGYPAADAVAYTATAPRTPARRAYISRAPYRGTRRVPGEERPTAARTPVVGSPVLDVDLDDTLLGATAQALYPDPVALHGYLTRRRPGSLDAVRVVERAPGRLTIKAAGRLRPTAPTVRGASPTRRAAR